MTPGHLRHFNLLGCVICGCKIVFHGAGHAGVTHESRLSWTLQLNRAPAQSEDTPRDTSSMLCERDV
eukprot:4753112-Prymnesium_polylepis.1